MKYKSTVTCPETLSIDGKTMYARTTWGIVIHKRRYKTGTRSGWVVKEEFYISRGY